MFYYSGVYLFRMSKTAGVLLEIRKGNLSDTSLENYRYTNTLYTLIIIIIIIIITDLIIPSASTIAKQEL